MNIAIDYNPIHFPHGGSTASLIITTEPVLNYLHQKRFPRQATVLAPSLDERELQTWLDNLPSSESVVGVGGGMCMDVAKYVAWKRRIPLYLAPSVISVDACLTETIAVRRGGRVVYVGEIYPEKVMIDFDLIQSAPKHLNRAGAGDILSIHTALFDWKLAHERTDEKYDAFIAEQSEELLRRLVVAAEEIKNVTQAGIRELVALYAAEVDLCHLMKNSRPEEGSEHFWAYNAEYLTGKSFVHGELVALGVILLSHWQGNQPDWIRKQIERLGVRWRPEEIGLDHRELISSMVTAQAYVTEMKLPYSIINEIDISEQRVAEIAAGW